MLIWRRPDELLRMKDHGSDENGKMDLLKTDMLIKKQRNDRERGRRDGI